MAKLERQSARRRPIRPPRMRTLPVFPKGPRLYRQKPGSDRMSGPGVPPAGFVTPTTSGTEWVVYWAISKVLGFPKDPRQGPYTGWPGLWAYQSPFEGGRAIRGGQIIDFIIESPSTNYGTVAIRVTTERYHVFTETAKRAKEVILQARIGRHVRIADIQEQDIVGRGKEDGQAAVLEVKRVIFGGRPSDPLRAGNARRIRW